MVNENKLTLKTLVDRGYSKLEGEYIDGYYPTNEKGIVLNFGGINYDTRYEKFFFQFSLYRLTRRVIVKTLSELLMIEDYWKTKNTRGASKEALKKLKEIKNTLENESLYSRSIRKRVENYQEHR